MSSSLNCVSSVLGLFLQHVVDSHAGYFNTSLPHSGWKRQAQTSFVPSDKEFDDVQYDCIWFVLVRAETGKNSAIWPPNPGEPPANSPNTTKRSLQGIFGTLHGNCSPFLKSNNPFIGSDDFPIGLT
jgi:hypothetical protein